MGVFNKLVKFPDRFIADQNIIANIIELKRNKMLLTEENYTCELSKETQEIAKKELNETNKLRKKAIADVRKWIKSRSNFRRARLDASFILRFLRMQKLDTMKVEQGPVEHEHTPVVRKKSRHDSGSQVLGMVGSMRKHEWQNEQ